MKKILLIGLICVCKFSNAQNTFPTGPGTSVGIGTITPATRLQVIDGAVLFNGTGVAPATNSGNLLLWAPTKGAFRAGNGSSTNWDDVNIGTNSFACGSSTKASGSSSFSAGSSNSATNSYSTVFGRLNASSGISSFSAGDHNFASGVSSTALGSANTASGSASTALGSSNTASGDYSACAGSLITAQAYNSMVIGRYNTNPGTYSTSAWVSTEPLFVVANGSSNLLRNNALTVLKSGNVLINKTSQINSTYILDVNGKIRANEVVINLTGADFVFEENYKLLPLAELEKAVKQDKHLPGIASADEMQKDGVGLSELNNSLLQKVEELTLYIIELNKRIDALENEVK